MIHTVRSRATRCSGESFGQLARRVHALGYAIYEVDEVCGFPRDCRNYLCVPSERIEPFERAAASANSSVSPSLRRVCPRAPPTVRKGTGAEYNSQWRFPTNVLGHACVNMHGGTVVE